MRGSQRLTDSVKVTLRVTTESRLRPDEGGSSTHMLNRYLGARLYVLL